MTNLGHGEDEDLGKTEDQGGEPCDCHQGVAVTG